jgi:hypothetical protein
MPTARRIPRLPNKSPYRPQSNTYCMQATQQWLPQKQTKQLPIWVPISLNRMSEVAVSMWINWQLHSCEPRVNAETGVCDCAKESGTSKVGIFMGAISF